MPAKLLSRSAFAIVVLFAGKTHGSWPELQTPVNDEEVFIFIEHYEEQG